MAVGMFILSHKQRRNLCLLFLAMNILQIILGCGMTGSSLYIIIAVSPILHSQRSEINFAFVVTGLYGTHVIFHWIVGIKICEKCFRQAHKKSTSNLFLLWSCLGTNTVLNLLIVSHFARKMNKQLSRSIKQSIVTGMSQYLRENIWKETIDTLQYKNECCGIDSYEDWHEMKWLTKYHVDVKSETVKQFKGDGDILTLPVTPWSCCKVDFPMQCLHDPIQQAQYAHIWVDEPTIVVNSINTKGCLDNLKRPIGSVTNVLIFLSSMVFISHLIIFIISRILYTSTRNAILLEDPEGKAPGWIFGRGDCGYAGGKTLLEIMESYPPAEEHEKIEDFVEGSENVAQKDGFEELNNTVITIKEFERKVPTRPPQIEKRNEVLTKGQFPSEGIKETKKSKELLKNEKMKMLKQATSDTKK
nr:peripherin-2 [Leptinotarsa decemlineata]